MNWLKSLYVNLYYFPIGKALHFPVLMGYNVKIESLGGRKAIEAPVVFGCICFGLKYDPFHMGYANSYWNIEKGASAVFKGTARFSKGTIFNIFSGGRVIVGNKFTSNANFLLSCADRIEIGEDVLLGWNITIMDNDGGHTMRKVDSDEITNGARPIIIGNHVWISAEASILKGSMIPAGSIIGYKSNVCGLKPSTLNSIIAGNPAIVVKEGFAWEH